MSLKLMYITNQEKIAQIAEKNGVDWIFVDLELNGKLERQGHLDTVISKHDIEDVKKIKGVLSTSELLVRVNPIYEGSKVEIDRVIEDGADIVMLPFFKTKEEVQSFVGYVNGRAKVCLLCETAEAVENIDSILTVEGIDYIHIGLNDLHLNYNMKFMFELITDGTVEMLCEKFNEKGIIYGFGGIAQLGQGMLPAENIITEHYRLGSNMAILSRSFCDTKRTREFDEVDLVFQNGLSEIRNFEEQLLIEEKSYFENNQKLVKNKVDEIVYSISKN